MKNQISSLANTGFERETTKDSPLFNDMLTIYRESITYAERKSESSIAAMTSNQDYYIELAICENVVVGFTIVYKFKPLNFSLLEYMAVDEDHRGREIGTRLLENVIRRLDASETLLLEVDAITDDGSGSVSRKRQAFYRRARCKVIDQLDYIMPLDMQLDKPKMVLMIYQTEKASLHREDLKLWLSNIYHEIYGKSLTDQRIERMLSNLGEDPSIV
jgi:ribosomal protein S18 acetylase RimI-like enzyme